ncbi:MAG: hypothetical protein AB7V32_04160 [Candidatus Berkiella sp.]
MWNFIKNPTATGQNATTQDSDPDLQRALEASLVQQDGADAQNVLGNDEEALFQLALAESKKTHDKEQQDHSTFQGLIPLLNAFEFTSEQITFLKENYAQFDKECPVSSDCLKRIHFADLVEAFGELNESSQDLLKVFVSMEFEQLKDSFVNQFNFFSNLRGNAKEALEALLKRYQSEQQNEAKQPAAIAAPVTAPKQDDEEDELAKAIALSKQISAKEPANPQAPAQVKSVKIGDGRSSRESTPVQSLPTGGAKSESAISTNDAADSSHIVKMKRMLALVCKVKAEDIQGSIQQIQQFSATLADQLALLDAFEKSKSERTLVGLTAFIATYQPSIAPPIISAKNEERAQPKPKAKPKAKEKASETDGKKRVARKNK